MCNKGIIKAQQSSSVTSLYGTPKAKNREGQLPVFDLGWL